MEDENRTTVELPSPDLAGDSSLEKTIQEGRSVRSYKDQSLTLEEVSQILWAAQGITDSEKGFRSAPSAGALYPLSVYVAASNVEDLGLYQYQVEDHELKQVKGKDVHDEIYQAALKQSSIQAGAIVIIITADYQITEKKYGDRAERYVQMEAGHVGQNIYLQATALDLGTVSVGAFKDDQIKDIIGLEREEPLYLFPIGRK